MDERSASQSVPVPANQLPHGVCTVVVVGVGLGKWERLQRDLLVSEIQLNSRQWY